ncbi:MAG: DUF2975 domain-containing protein [Thalassobaculum sp.]|uniref:DUF2975 domain-containing protein n=1 Tax=Thalassobaculum sp. TaxID=2022740 RepID=UPI0032EFC811
MNATSHAEKDARSRLMRLAGLLRWMLLAVAAAIPAAALLIAVLAPQWVLQRAGLAGLPLDLAAGDPWRLRAAIAVGAVPSLVLIWGLARLSTLFRRVAEGEVFSEPGARALRDFAVAVLAHAALAPPAHTAVVLVLTLANPPGQRQLAIALGSDDVAGVVIGLVFLAVAWILREGRRIADENALMI